MANYPEQTSFEKGQQFENYIENVVFPRELYALVEKTHDHTTNSRRYVESSHKPDFKFRCKSTNKTFHVEAKYRSSNYDDPIPLYSEKQFELHNKIHQQDGPVFVALGCAGTPAKPDELYVARIDKLLYAEPFRSRFIYHKVGPGPIHCESLDFSGLNIANKEEENEKSDLESSNKSKTRMILWIALIVLLSSVFYYVFSERSDSDIRDTITEYYQILDANNINAMDAYVHDEVDRWYTSRNMSLETIKKDTRRYRAKYPKTSTQIDWGTYKENELQNGDINVQYEMDYVIYSTAKVNRHEFRLLIHSVWSKEKKLKSMWEERLSVVK